MMTRDIPTGRKRGASERFDIDERERASVQALSNLSGGVDVEVPYIQGRLDSVADELGVELLAISIHLGATKLFVRAHEDVWTGAASESSAQLVLDRRGDGVHGVHGVQDGYRKLAVRGGEGQRLGSLHVMRHAGVELGPLHRARLEALADELGTLLCPR